MSAILEIVEAIVVRLKGHAPLAALVGDRVFDAVPKGALFPYVSIGPTDEMRDDSDCIDGAEITVQIDVWSRAVGAPESLRIAEEVRQALKPDLVLTENALVLFEHRNTRRFRAPDGLTNHAALEFRAIVEHP